MEHWIKEFTSTESSEQSNSCTEDDEVSECSVQSEEQITEKKLSSDDKFNEEEDSSESETRFPDQYQEINDDIAIDTEDPTAIFIS